MPRGNSWYGVRHHTRTCLDVRFICTEMVMVLHWDLTAGDKREEGKSDTKLSSKCFCKEESGQVEPVCPGTCQSMT